MEPREHSNIGSFSLFLAVVLSLLILPDAGRARPLTACVRHEPVGFFTQPAILGELGQVYANCYTHPVCADPTDLETIQIDGYNDGSQWLWQGLSTHTFSVAEQNALINDAIVRATAVAPPGKVIISMAFFRDIIVGPDPVEYVMYFTVTFAHCAQSQKGMTWIHSRSNAQTGTITVGCSGCDPYEGDTVCTELRPVLCIFKPTPPFQLPAALNNSDRYNVWSGGVVATTEAVAGMNRTAADSLCQDRFGPGWRAAEFHDGRGFNFQAYGGTVNAPTVPSTRFWVYINDQNANCP